MKHSVTEFNLQDFRNLSRQDLCINLFYRRNLVLNEVVLIYFVDCICGIFLGSDGQKYDTDGKCISNGKDVLEIIAHVNYKNFK